MIKFMQLVKEICFIFAAVYLLTHNHPGWGILCIILSFGGEFKIVTAGEDDE